MVNVDGIRERIFNMGHGEGAVKGGKTVITTSLAGLLAYYTLPLIGYTQAPLDPVIYTGLVALFAGGIKYVRNIANQVLAQFDMNITL